MWQVFRSGNPNDASQRATSFRREPTWTSPPTRAESGASNVQVTEVMSRNVPVCSPQDSIARLAQQMTSSRYRHMPVVDRGRLVGLVSIGDVVKARLTDMELETGLLRDLYIARS